MQRHLKLELGSLTPVTRGPFHYPNRKQPPTDQKEMRSFRHPTDTEKWCEIHEFFMFPRGLVFGVIIESASRPLCEF
jgi:hypothetical protein